MLSKTSTTCRTCTPTSTSPTRSCSWSRPDVAPPRLSVGDRAPDFTLAGTPGDSYSLGDFRGQTVVLVFYPGDHTPVCTVQLNSYSTDIGQFEKLGAQILAISPQSVESHEHFSGVHNFSFPLLADIDKSVGRSYGVLGPVGFYKRSVFVVDRNGIVRYAHRATAGLTFRSTAELVRAVQEAQAAPAGA
ncbi:MAG: peroxiredoxin [Actinobacteria bacterium]|nr:peroxiredoxin [Actinomycetota bacterium]